MHDGLERLAQPGAARVGERVVGAVAGDRRLAGDDLAHDVHVLAGPGQGLLERLAVPALDDLGPGHPQSEHEPAPDRWSRVMAAMPMAVGVRADSWHRAVPRRTRLVCEPHQPRGVRASEP